MWVVMGRVIGHVDGFRADILHGWLADLDDPSTLAQFIVRGDRGPDLIFSANFYRPDVCQAHAINGIFGFAIKRAWLNPNSRAVAILTPQGEVLPGGECIMLPDLQEAAAPGPVDIFLHLAKTAGTSIRHAMTSQFSEGEAILVYPGTEFGVGEHLLPTIPLFQRQRLRLVIGHCSFGIHDPLDVPAHYSVFLRRPADRLRSNMAHHAAARTVFAVDGRHTGLAAIINEGLSEEFDNLMVRVLAGLSRDDAPLGTVSGEDVESALVNVRDHFKFVGLHETLPESFAGLCEALDLPSLDLPVDNVTPKRWTEFGDQVPGVDWAALLHRNRHDFALYQAIQDCGLVGRIQ
jgi:hypothetical protein